MTLAADRRAREDLDLFLLALISQGIDTPYRMQSLARISQGTSLQAIRRLLEHELIRSSAEGSRRRKTWSLTRAGRNRLQRDYRPREPQGPINNNFEGSAPNRPINGLRPWGFPASQFDPECRGHSVQKDYGGTPEAR
jgi:DNA-binding PadR family transcriptional regulator